MTTKTPFDNNAERQEPERPDPKRADMQLQPDYKWVIDLDNGGPVNYGKLIVYTVQASKKLRFTNADGTPTDYPDAAPGAATEYWFDLIDWTKLQFDSTPSSISVTKTSLNTLAGNPNIYNTGDAKPVTVNTFSSACDASGIWPSPGTPTAAPTAASGDGAAGAWYFSYRTDSGPRWTENDRVLEIKTGGASTTTGVVWWRMSYTATPKGTITPTGTWNITATPTGTANWYTKSSLGSV